MPKSFEFRASGPPVDERMKEAVARGLALAAEEILGRANKRVPHEEGTLQRSGRSSVDPDQLMAAISYDTPYAVRQHEDMALRHQDGRTAKWLENAMNENKDLVLEIVARTVKGEL